MENPSDITIQTYRHNFRKYVERTCSVPSDEFKAWMDLFAAEIPQDGKILEVGSASGRDARYFAAKGFRVMCTDVIPEALQQLSEQGFETAEFDFRDDPKAEWAGKYDGFFANAVLLHAPLDVFKKALKSIALVLKDSGVAAFSLKTGEGEAITVEKMDAPRYFRYHSESEIREILSELPFEIISLSHASEGKWLQVIMKLRSK